MGMYTKFEFEGTVKPQYRPIIQALYDTDLDFKEAVHKLKMVPFYDLVESERGDMMFYGSQWEDETKFDESSGFWHLECEIKDYPEDGKPKKSSELFKDAIPLIFEDGMTAWELYEEYMVATKYELQKGILKRTNEQEIKRAINNGEYYW